MNDAPLLLSKRAAALACFSLVACFAGCASESSSSYRRELRSDADYRDDYVYYPEYETYYSYRRHEFVYVDDGIWVRRPEPPRGTTINVILAAPSVPLDFHDAPERHHHNVAHSYPKNWRDAGTNQPAPQAHPRSDAKPEPREGPSQPRETKPSPPRTDPAPAPRPPEHRNSKPKPPAPQKAAPHERRQKDQAEGNKGGAQDGRKDDQRDVDKGPKQ